MSARRSSVEGFTLVEVLVAILILSTLMATTLALVSQSTANVDRMRSDVLARIAAENALVDVTLAARTGVREEQGVEEISASAFAWTASRRPAPVSGFEIVTIEVRDPVAPERVAARLETLAVANVVAP